MCTGEQNGSRKKTCTGVEPSRLPVFLAVSVSVNAPVAGATLGEMLKLLSSKVV